MVNKHPALVVYQLSLLVDPAIPDEHLHEIESTLREKLSAFWRETAQGIDSVEPLVCSKTYYELNPEHLNCFKCEHCGRWTTDYTKAHELPGIEEGCKFEGMYVCSQCETWKHHPEYGWADE